MKQLCNQNTVKEHNPPEVPSPWDTIREIRRGFSEHMLSVEKAGQMLNQASVNSPEVVEKIVRKHLNHSNPVVREYTMGVISHASLPYVGELLGERLSVEEVPSVSLLIGETLTRMNASTGSTDYTLPDKVEADYLFLKALDPENTPRLYPTVAGQVRDIELSDEAFSSRLNGLLTDGNDTVRQHTLRILGATGNPKYLRTLMDRIDSEENPENIVYAAESVFQIQDKNGIKKSLKRGQRKRLKKALEDVEGEKTFDVTEIVPNSKQYTEIRKGPFTRFSQMFYSNRDYMMELIQLRSELEPMFIRGAQTGI
jgi:hypothetical protein